MARKNAARLTAIQAAQKNIEERLKNLNGLPQPAPELNHQRAPRYVSGFEALRSQGNEKKSLQIAVSRLQCDRHLPHALPDSCHLTTAPSFLMNAGLCLQILSPAPGQTVHSGSHLIIHIQVALACGCPAGAGGRYDYRRFQIRGSLAANDGEPVLFALSPRRDAGEFQGRVEAQSPGDALLTIEAYDPESGMAGRAKTTFRVR